MIAGFFDPFGEAVCAAACLAISTARNGRKHMTRSGFTRRDFIKLPGPPRSGHHASSCRVEPMTGEPHS